MKKDPNKRLVGIFLVAGIIFFGLIIGRVVWNKYVSAKKDIFVMYFDESLQGLSEGASIVFQGVEVGKVVSIKLIANPSELKFQVPVYGHFKSKDFLPHNDGWDLWDSPNLLEELVKRGLRARLTTQNYLTGQLMIELVMLPENKIEKSDNQETDFKEIPTVMSKTGVIAKRLDTMDIKSIMNRIDKVCNVLEKEIPEILPALSSGAKNLDNLLKKFSARSEETLNNANKMMQDISDTSRSIQNLTDYLERHPESLLRGKN